MSERSKKQIIIQAWKGRKFWHKRQHEEDSRYHAKCTMPDLKGQMLSVSTHEEPGVVRFIDTDGRMLGSRDMTLWMYLTLLTELCTFFFTTKWSLLCWGCQWAALGIEGSLPVGHGWPHRASQLERFSLAPALRYIRKGAGWPPFPGAGRSVITVWSLASTNILNCCF